MVSENPLRHIIEKRKKQPDTIKQSDKQAVSHEEPHWMDEANCKGKTHLMFPRHHKDISYITQARAICRGCDVRSKCLDYALQWPATDMHGIWGGLTPRQLAAEQQRRGIRPAKPTLAQLWNDFTKDDRKPSKSEQ